MKSDEFIFREASAEDNKSIKELLAQPDFGGEIQLLYTRGQDPIASFQQDGDEVLILGCIHQPTKRLAGFGVASIMNLWVEGKKERVAYLSGLRVHPDFRKKTLLLHKAYDFMMTWLKERNIFFIVTSILRDHVAVQRMLEKRRKSMPWYHFLGNYRVHVLPRKKKALNRAYVLKKGHEIHRDRWKEFYRNSSKNHCFFPDWDQIREEDLRLLMNPAGEILAASQFLKREDKKHYLHDYRGKARILAHLGKLPGLLGYPVMPKAGSFLDYEYLSYALAAPGQEEALVLLFQQMAMEREHLHYLLAGSMETSSLQQFLGKYVPLHYDSRIYLVDPWKDGRVEMWIQKNRELYYEISSL